MNRIKLSGYRNPNSIIELFASHFVDVAYVDEVLEDCVYLVADSPSGFDREEFVWFKEVCELTFARYGLAGITIELEGG